MSNEQVSEVEIIAKTTPGLADSKSFTPRYLGKTIEESVVELDLIPWTGNDIKVTLNCTEFTANCPRTKMPDFAKIIIEYKPNKYLAETKSVKLFMQSFRSVFEFNEIIVNNICAIFQEQIQPKWIKVTGEFAIRGGVWVKAESELPSHE